MPAPLLAGATDAASLRSPSGPIAGAQRIVTLDVLRGVAIMGILAVNIDDFAGPELLPDIPIGLPKAALVGWHASLDLLILAGKWLFVEGKMRGLLSMLFGAGVILMSRRIERRSSGREAAGLFVRRNLWLAVFGFVHGAVIWNGDILFSYAACALLFLYPMRRMPARMLIAAGLLIWLFGSSFALHHARRGIELAHEAAAGSRAGIAADAARPLVARRGDGDGAAMAPGPAIAAEVERGREGFLPGLRARIAGNQAHIYGFFRYGAFVETVGEMLLGMGLLKSGFLGGLRRRSLYLATALLGYAVAAPLVLVGLWKARESGFSADAYTLWLDAPYAVEQIPVTLANASLVILFATGGCCRRAVGMLACVGRAALSNYVLTSLLCQWLFAWGPWKLFGRLEYRQYPYVVAAVWLFNLIASSLWLRRFAFGPLEWAWRSLTYWARQPMRPSRSSPSVRSVR